MLQAMFDRVKPTYFCSSQLQGQPEKVENDQRIKIKCDKILEDYKVKGILG